MKNQNYHQLMGEMHMRLNNLIDSEADSDRFNADWRDFTSQPDWHKLPRYRKAAIKAVYHYRRGEMWKLMYYNIIGPEGVEYREAENYGAYLGMPTSYRMVSKGYHLWKKSGKPYTPRPVMGETKEMEG